MVEEFWRVFPWDRGAEPGAPFSATHLPSQSGQGRFDLPPHLDASSWYFAESAEHAVGEKIQDLRSRKLSDGFLFERGHRLACCSARETGALEIADLCDPVELAQRRIAPDELASRHRSVTQPIAQGLHGDPGLAGFRWWSAFWGDWHTVVLFSDRLPGDALRFDEPEPLHPDTPALVRATDALGIEIIVR